MTGKIDLSENTLKILENYSKINNNIKFIPGNNLRIMSVATDVVAFTEVEEEFPLEVNIYNLSRITSAINKLQLKPTLNFTDSYLEIGDKKNKVTITYRNEIDIQSPPPGAKGVTIDEKLTFEFSQELLKRIIDSMAIFQNDLLVIETKAGKLVAYTIRDDLTQSTSDGFECVLGECPVNLEAKVILKAETLKKLMPDSYSIVVGLLNDSIMFKFTADEWEIDYYLSSHSNSTINEVESVDSTIEEKPEIESIFGEE